MNDTDSVTLTKKVVITASNLINKEEFLKKILEFADKLMEFLNLNGCEKLGHIKFISTTDGEDYLQVSMLDCSEKPEIKGTLRKTFQKVNTTINIIEFGVKKEIVVKKINEEVEHIESYFSNS
jgi:hypothetical protein